MDYVSLVGTVDLWAWGLSDVTNVGGFVDETFLAYASSGLSRPDIKDSYPDAPDIVGFEYSLDTTESSKGSHAVVVKVTGI